MCDLAMLKNEENNGTEKIVLVPLAPWYEKKKRNSTQHRATTFIWTAKWVRNIFLSVTKYTIKFDAETI